MSEEQTAKTNEAAPAGSKELARLVASILEELKGEDVVLLRMDEVLPITDYFVIATGLNARHVDALSEEVYMALKKRGRLPINRSGREEKTWVLMDYGDVVVHIQQDEARRYYDLELLWADAERVE